MLRLQEGLQKEISEEVWRSADDQVRKLVCNEGGHLCCEPSKVLDNELLQKATLGMIREVNRDANQIILTGSEWIEPIVAADPKRRNAQDLILMLENWINQPEDKTPLPELLEIAIDSELLDRVYKFYRRLKDVQFHANATIELNINIDLHQEEDSSKKVIIVGPKIWESFFLRLDYQSALLLTTKSENSFDLTTAMQPDSGNRYLQAAIAAIAERYGCGAWKTAYVPREILPDLSESVGWDNPEKQFSKLFRTSFLGPAHSPEAHFHNHYLFVHSSRGDRDRDMSVVPANKLVLV